MRVLLDTNILIHRETAFVVRNEIGDVFRWLDRIGAEKCIHPHSFAEINKHQDENVVRSFNAKLRSYHQLQTLAADPPVLSVIRENDQTENDSIDTDLIREVLAERVDVLISEDRGVHTKARTLGISNKVLGIESFLEKVIRDNPDLVDYQILSVRKQYFGNINLTDPFFDSFRRDYPGFDLWYNRKADEMAYVCQDDDSRVLAFLYLKLEGTNEPYPDIEPKFQPKHRLKIGTFKVTLAGYNLGERFLKIIFDNALVLNCEEIYVTAFEQTVDQKCLIRMLEKWGFQKHGIKRVGPLEEGVWIRSFTPIASERHPANTYPYMSMKTSKFIVPIYPKYHTELLPDSILNTESPLDYIENRPNRNAIRKAYISRSYFRDLRVGDIIVFYRTKSETGPAHYTAVATSLGIVESVHQEIIDFSSFRRACRGASVFTDEQLREHWDYTPRNRPFVVRFLYTYSFPRRPNLSEMKQAGVLVEHPRGFERLTDVGFNKLLEISHAQDCPVVDKA